MRVLFANPHYTHDPFTLLLHPPLCYGYLSTLLKPLGHDIVHADLPFEGNSPESIIPFLENFKPDIVGVTSVAQSYFHALEIAKVIKKYDPNILTVFGGPHPTFIPEECLQRHSSVDFVILYDGEDSLPLLLEALENNGQKQLSKVPGLAYRTDDGHIEVTNPDAPVRDLDRYPKVDRSIFDMERYLKYDYETVIMTARGCPSKCTFCSTTKMGRRFRWNEPERICDEIEEVLDIGFSSIFFGDDTFTGNKPRTFEFCKEIKRRGINIPWTSNMRAQDATPKILEAIREAGAYRVFMGFESIQNTTLDLVKKGTTLENLYHTAQLVKSYDLELHAAFIVGAPGDTHESLKSTMDYIRLVSPTVATFNVMEPRPGTDVYHNPEKYGILIPNPFWYETTEWLTNPVCESDHLSKKEIREWVSKCYDEFCSPDFLDSERLKTLEHKRVEWNSEPNLPWWSKLEHQELPVLQ